MHRDANAILSSFRPNAVGKSYSQKKQDREKKWLISITALVSNPYRGNSTLFRTLSTLEKSTSTGQ